MKKISLVALSSATAMSFAASAFAQDAAKGPAPQVTPYGFLEAAMVLQDSESQKAPDFKAASARMGLKVQQDIVRAQIEVQFSGDNKTVDRNGSTTTDGTTTETGVVENGGQVSVRLANVGIDHVVNARLGRVRPGGATGWGNDATSTPHGYGSMDGLMLSKDFTIAEGATVGASFTYANSLRYDDKLVQLNQGTDYGSRAVKADDAMVVGLTANVNNVTADLFYGSEKNTVLTRKATVAGASEATDVATAADSTHIEAALGYQLDNIGAGVWYQEIKFGDVKPVTKNEGGKLTLGDKVANSTTKKLVGVGVAGDSTLFGLSNMITADDKLTYSAAYAMSSSRTSGATGEAKTAEEDADTAEISAGLGYAIGAYNVGLVYGTASSKAKQFKSSKGEAGQKKSANVTYLYTSYTF